METSRKSATLHPLHNALDPLRKGFGGHFYQVIAQRGVGFFMDLLEKERFFKGDLSCLCGLAEPEIFEKEDLSLIHVLALKSLQFFEQTSRGRISKMAAQGQGTDWRTIVHL